MFLALYGKSTYDAITTNEHLCSIQQRRDLVQFLARIPESKNEMRCLVQYYDGYTCSVLNFVEIPGASLRLGLRPG